MLHLLLFALLALASVSADSSAASSASSAGNAVSAYSQAEAQAWTQGSYAQSEAWSRAIAAPTAGTAIKPYCSSLLLTDTVFYYIRAYILNWVVPLPWQRSYARILEARGTVAVKLYNGLLYDSAYDIPALVSLLTSLNPVTARSNTLNFYNRIYSKLAAIINLIINVLNQTQNVALCDARVSAIVQANPWWNSLAALTIEVGKLSQQFVNLRGNIEYAAVNLKEKELYINGKALLKNWIVQTYEVIKRVGV